MQHCVLDRVTARAGQHVQCCKQQQQQQLLRELRASAKVPSAQQLQLCRVLSQPTPAIGAARACLLGRLQKQPQLHCTL
jgi:hypothetical protein